MLVGLIALLLGGGLVIQSVRLTGALRHRRRARAGFLDLVAARMLHLRRATLPTGFPRLSGVIDGAEFDLQVVPDSLTFRKLPALWLLVTLPQPLPVRQRLDLMVRPRGVEPFSTFDQLPVQTAMPPGFPLDVALRSELPVTADEAALLLRHRGLLDDPRIKELVIAPQGLRITWLADEAERGRYLIFREAEMGQQPLDPQALAPLLAALTGLRDDILSQDPAGIPVDARVETRAEERKCA